MLLPANIATYLRLVFTAITLLLVVGLNNREVTTFASAPEANTEQQVTKSSADRHVTVKQKVSFEATSSYLVLQLAAVCPELARIIYGAPLIGTLPDYRPITAATHFFNIFLSSVIQPNAP